MLKIRTIQIMMILWGVVIANESDNGDGGDNDNDKIDHINDDDIVQRISIL